MSSTDGFTELPAVARAIWARALRCGGYDRCRTFLGMLTPTGQYRFSSLGVACEEFRRRYPDRLQAREVSLAAAGFLCLEYGDGSLQVDRFYLPDVVRRWLGLADTAGSLQPHYHHLGYRSLCELDDENFGFEKLADLIDAGALISTDGEKNGSG
jgi:hypothetical protein